MQPSVLVHGMCVCRSQRLSVILFNFARLLDVKDRISRMQANRRFSANWMKAFEFERSEWEVQQMNVPNEFYDLSINAQLS